MLLTTVLSTLTLLLAACQGVAQSRLTGEDLPPPTIWLSSYTQVDSLGEISAVEEYQTETQFQNDFIIKNGTDYIVSGDTNAVIFNCNASYPLTWHFPKGAQIENLSPYAFETHTNRISEFHSNQPQPINRFFEATLFIDFLYSDFFSVTLECRRATRSNGSALTSLKTARVHVFYEGTKVMERMDEIIQVYVPPYKKDDKSPNATVTLPCRPATPKVKLLLEKLMYIKQKGGITIKKWIKVNVPSKYVTFDPKLGFVLVRDIIKGEKIFGLYRCTALNGCQDNPGDDTYCVYVNVTTNKPKDNQWAILHPGPNDTLQLKGNASVGYLNQTFGNHSFHLPQSNYSNKGVEIRCCSGRTNGTAPGIYSDACQDRVQCQVLHQGIVKRLQEGAGSYRGYQGSSGYRQDCSRNFLRTIGIVMCVGDNVTFEQHFVHVFEDKVAPVVNGSQEKFPGRFLPETLWKWETEAKATMAPLPQKLLLVMGYSLTGDELLRNRRYYHHYSGITLSEVPPAFSDRNAEENDETPYDEFHHFGVAYREARADKIAEYPRDVYYEGEPLVPVCLGWKYLYSQGGWLSVTWKNGSRTILQSAPLSRSGFKTIYLSKERGTLDLGEGTVVHKIGGEIPAHRNMTAVECWMPQWNTGKWDKMARNLTILGGQAPRFVEGFGNGSEEVIYYNMNDKDKEGPKELECVVGNTTPEPRLNVTKDGIGILGLFQGINHTEQEFIPSKWGHLIKVTIFDNDTAPSNATITIKIRFTRVISDIGGVYQCTAENVRGKVTKTFRVVVQEKTTIVVSILVSTSLLSFLLLILGASYYEQQRNDVPLSGRNPPK